MKPVMAVIKQTLGKISGMFSQTNQGHRRTRRFFGLPYKLAAISVIAIAIGVGVFINWQHQLYRLSPSESRLLSKSSINQYLIKQTKQGFSYNHDQERKPGVGQVTVASPADATGVESYQADLPKNLAQGITFGSTSSQLSFKIIPEQSSSTGQLKDGRVTYPENLDRKHVYTFKRNGLKEDIILNRSPGKTLKYSWKLELGDNLTAKMLPTGEVGIYSANPYLYGNLTVSDTKSQQLIDNARKQGDKTSLVFILPAPYIKDAAGLTNREDVSYRLDGNVLTLEARNLNNKKYPLTIDPTVVVTTTAEFRTGTDSGMIDYSTSGQITRSTVSIGTTAALTTNTNYFSIPRYNHASVVYNGYLYVLGGSETLFDTNCKNTGISSTSCNDVQYAPINSDGSLGTFTTNTNYFSIPRSRIGSVAYNGYLYVMGGQQDGSDTNCKNAGSGIYCNDVQYAPINSDGSVGTFTTNSNYFSIPRGDFISLAYNGYLYINGGQEPNIDTNCKNGGSSSLCNDVQYAPINSDGSLGTFTTNTNYFSFPRWDHTSVAYNGYLYIIGGYEGSSNTSCKNGGTTTYCDDVQYAPINSDGSVGTFATNANYFSINRSNHTSVAINGYMYVIGGFQPTSNTNCKNAGTSFYCNDVQYAPINADGSVGTFATNANYFSIPRSGLRGTFYNGYLYFAGGVEANSDTNCKNAGTSTTCNDIQYASINTGTPSFGTVGATTQQTAAFTTARYGHSSVAYNGYVYIIGGFGVSNLNDIIHCPINSDGSVGTCVQQTNAFTTARYEHSSVAYNGYLYIIGGCGAASCNSQVTDQNDIQHCPINSDGSVGTCVQQTNAFTNARNEHTSVVYKGYLYVIGGCKDGNCTSTGTALNDIIHCPINSDGSVGTCVQQTNAFTGARYWHAGAVYNGYIYIIGGNTGSAQNDIQHCPINSDGSVGVCTQQAAAFTTARYELAGLAYDGYLYVIGGFGGSRQNDIQHCPINSDGSVGACTQQAAAFTTARNSHSSVTYNGYMYVIGGTSGSNQNDIQHLGIHSPPQIAQYERVIDLGSVQNFNSVSFNGAMVCGGKLDYRMAGGSGVYGATTALPFVLPGTTYSISSTSKRYLWIRFTLDDSSCGTNSNITDITLDYSIPNGSPAAPTLDLPATGAIGVTIAPVFQLKSTDSDGDYLQYKLEICTTSNCSSVLHTINQTTQLSGWTGMNANTGTAYTASPTLANSHEAYYYYGFTDLVPGTQYWWRAYAIDPAGLNVFSTASAISSFTIATQEVQIKGGTTIQGGTKISN